jgi:allantoinase
METKIINGQLVTEHGIYLADIGIEGGRVAALAAPGSLPPAEQVIDAAGLLVLPGAVDIHFHARTPAYTERGDFYTESRAAAAGGVTTIFEMPISKPGCATPEIFLNRRRLAEEQCVVDFALYGAPGTLDHDDVLGMAAEGAIAFKIFMHRAPLGRDDEFIGICLTEDHELYQALALVKETGRRLVVHCESDSLLEWGLAQMQAQGRTDMRAHLDSRPPVVEAVAVARLLTLAEALKAPVHVAHVSCAQALQVIRRFQRDGLDVTAETCPHYLFFDDEDYMRLGPYAKINPPIRSAADQAALWQGIAEGCFSAITTDHATYLAAEKERGWEGILRAPAGAPGVQALLPILMTAALRDKRLSLEQVVRLISSEPARLFNVAPRKGTLQPGADADICLYDPRPATVFRYEQMLSQARDIDKLYLNLPLQGRVVSTLVRGQVVFHEGEILVPAGSGQFVRPQIERTGVRK